MKVDRREAKMVNVQFGDRILKVIEGPYSYYSDGYAWFKFGSVGVVPGEQRFRVEVDAPNGANVSLDAIVLATGDFHPSGIHVPEAQLPANISDKPAKPKTGRGH